MSRADLPLTEQGRAELCKHQGVLTLLEVALDGNEENEDAAEQATSTLSGLFEEDGVLRLALGVHTSTSYKPVLHATPKVHTSDSAQTSTTLPCMRALFFAPR